MNVLLMALLCFGDVMLLATIYCNQKQWYICSTYKRYALYALHVPRFPI